MLVEKDVALQPYTTLSVVARAALLARVRDTSDVTALLEDQYLRRLPRLILGGGSNVVLTRDVDALVLKIEIRGRQILAVDAKGVLLEVGAGERWHDVVQWSLQQGYGGLENLALIPGTVGAAPVQNIGAYGVELQDRFHSLDAIDLTTGQALTLNAAQCGFGYRDSVFKHHDRLGLAGRALITRVRLWLPRPWRPELGYGDLQRRVQDAGMTQPDARTIFDWVCAIRRGKLPDPAVLGNVGSFFKNPTVSAEQCQDIIARDPGIVFYPLPDGRIKLAAGWLIEACGWKGKTVGHAGVHADHALVLVNHGGATGGEVMTLARAIQTSVYERFGIRLEPEPVVV